VHSQIKWEVHQKIFMNRGIFYSTDFYGCLIEKPQLLFVCVLRFFCLIQENDKRSH
jgi:hypothetical protein